MVGLASFWMVGSIFSAGMGWAIIPASRDAWRTFLAVASLPAWCAAVGTWFMPESPRFLLVQGYTEAAEQVGLLLIAAEQVGLLWWHNFVGLGVWYLFGETWSAGSTEIGS